MVYRLFFHTLPSWFCQYTTPKHLIHPPKKSTLEIKNLHFEIEKLPYVKFFAYLCNKL